ncbi:lipopolysaccharide-induced tumor necrosis factor-alpha factor homolog [Dendroctonus ponderosae]|uniref:LITAF domain-containing protein n=1 Tax=Dendroctonus ponderosae TaxID=77166 RepID=A0AAR5PE92_DENPD|nr:lipopolysaccharide-induced tumor necrosis factor-alpha factor homolog [Dendroctonus ponderosae]
MLHSKTQADEKLTHISKAPPQMAGLQLKKPELLPAQFNVAWGPHSVSLTCPFCHHYTITTVRSSPKVRTHLLALLLFAIGCICCFWIPYTKKSYMSRKHYCSHCDACLGVYNNN